MLHPIQWLYLLMTDDNFTVFQWGWYHLAEELISPDQDKSVETSAISTRCSQKA